MSPFFDDLERQLSTAARAQTSRGRAPRRRWLARPPAGWPSTVPIALAVATTAAVAAIALLMIPHGGGGTPGQPRMPSAAYLINHTPKPQLDRELGYLEKASSTTSRSAACSSLDQHRTRLVPGTPSAALLAALPVLRTRATAADAPRRLLSGVDLDVLRGATRRVADADGASYYVVPTRIGPATRANYIRCMALQRRALRRELANESPTVRGDTLRIDAAATAYMRRRVYGAAGGTFCTALVQAGHDHSVDYSCGASIAQLGSNQIQTTGDHGLYLGLVPNGVASVTLRFGSRSYSGRVRRNAYVIRTGVRGDGALDGTIWRAADGHVIKDIHARGGSNLTATAYCRRRPVACLVLGAGRTSSETSSGSGSATASATVTSASAAPKR